MGAEAVAVVGQLAAPPVVRLERRVERQRGRADQVARLQRVVAPLVGAAETLRRRGRKTIT